MADIVQEVLAGRHSNPQSIRRECPNEECGAVCEYLRICFGKAVEPAYCAQCGGPLNGGGR